MSDDAKQASQADRSLASKNRSNLPSDPNPSPDQSQTDLENPLTHRQFEVLRAVRYHRRRQQMLERRHHLATVIAFMFSAATITTLLASVPSDWSWISAAFAAVVTVATVCDLVFSFARTSWVHSELANRYLAIQRRLALIDEERPDLAQQMREVDAQVTEIEMDEPPVLKVLNAMCYNEAIAAFLGREAEAARYLLPIGPVQRFLAPYMDLFPSRITDGR